MNVGSAVVNFHLAIHGGRLKLYKALLRLFYPKLVRRTPGKHARRMVRLNVRFPLNHFILAIPAYNKRETKTPNVSKSF